VKINPAAELRGGKSRGDYSSLSLISKRKSSSWEARQKLILRICHYYYCCYYYYYCYFFMTSLSLPPRKFLLMTPSKK